MQDNKGGTNIRRESLILYKTQNGNFRTVIKTKHSRVIYLEISLADDTVAIGQCYYLDRGRITYPQKLTTKEFPFSEILSVITAELDRKYYSVEMSIEYSELTKEDFIATQLGGIKKKYNFLIFLGEGEFINDVPSIIKTRFKNKIHRCIYLELHYRNGKGIISDCHYEDREYKARTNVIPETLSTVFFNYDRDTIVHIINTELDTNFTDIIFVTDGSINIKNKVALCGNI